MIKKVLTKEVSKVWHDANDKNINIQVMPKES